MLVLPSGQVLAVPGNTAPLYVDTLKGSPRSSWLPAIASIITNFNGSFRLTGTLLIGLSDGACYGDDDEKSSSYPIICLADAQVNVFYAWIFDWSRSGVATGSTSVSTDFRLPAGIPGGVESLCVVANGMPSKAVSFTVTSPAAELSGSFNLTGIATDESTFGGADSMSMAIPSPRTCSAPRSLRMATNST
jgi:hypothetical protein